MTEVTGTSNRGVAPRRELPSAHRAAVARLQRDYAAIPPGSPVRLAKRTSNLFRFPGGDAHAGLDVSAFGHVVSVDPATHTAVVGGMTTYEDLADATLAYDLMPLVVPQLKTITLGGAVTGLGIESTSLRSGLPHESVTEMEILTGDGRVVTATDDNEHAALYRGFPNSYGTLGYALSLTIKLEPVMPYVHLRHFRFDTPEACMDAVAQIAADGSYHGHRADFVDGTAFSLDEMYLTVGAFSEVAPWRSDYTREPHLLPVDPRAQGRLPHDPRLPVALGHRLVLVRGCPRCAEPRDPPGLAASVPPLGHLPQDDRLRPQVRPVLGAERPPRPAITRVRGPGRGHPGRARRGVPALVRPARRHEPGLDLPDAAARHPAQRAKLAAVPAAARRRLRELRLLGHPARCRPGPGTATTTGWSRKR